MIDPTVLIAIIAALGAAFTAVWNKRKSKDDLFTAQLSAMTVEIDRLRKDLAERDTQAQENFEQINTLRAEVQQSNIKVYHLEAQLTEWATGVRVLTNQLEQADIRPAFIPS